MEDTIRDAWKQAELEDIKRTEGAYDSLIGKLTKYTNLVSKKAYLVSLLQPRKQKTLLISQSRLTKRLIRQGIYVIITQTG